MSGSLALALYLGASACAGPIARPLLTRRAARGKEDRDRLGERFGEPSLPRPPGPLIWLHGASVGETLSTLPLIAALTDRAPACQILVTSGTVTSAQRMAVLSPEGTRHQYAPIDSRAAVRQFLGHWRPDLAIWIESELWPRLIIETAARGTPMMLVNARLSARSTARWARAPRMAAALLRRFARILAQDHATVDRLIALGADPDTLRYGGNLKVAAPPPDADPGELAEIRSHLAGRTAWLAASTHEGEEETILAVQRRLPGATRPLLMLAPRHPERGGDIAELIAATGLRLARRSQGGRPEADTDVWLVDTLGEMGLWYRIAPASFVGGSLAGRGGHNPFEPAALGSAILHGPDTANFAPAYAALAAAGGTREVSDADSLHAALSALLAAPDTREAMANAARRVRAEMAPDLDALADEALSLMAPS